MNTMMSEKVALRLGLLLPTLFLLAGWAAISPAGGGVANSFHGEEVLVLLMGLAFGGFFGWRSSKGGTETDPEVVQALENQVDRLRHQRDEALATRGTAEKLTSLEVLVARVAQELNTPLSSALRILADMQRQLEDSQEGGSLTHSTWQPFLVRQCHEVDKTIGWLLRCAELIDRFQRLSDQENARHRRQLPLEDLVTGCADAWNSRFQKAGHHLQIGLDPTVRREPFPEVLAKVLMHLIDNAVRHAFNPGEHGLVEILAENRDDHLVLTVADDGRGMDETALLHLFDPFYTHDRPDHFGAGLGLLTVHHLVQVVLGGNLVVRSEAGLGTRVEIHLPSPSFSLGTPASPAPPAP